VVATASSSAPPRARVRVRPTRAGAVAALLATALLLAAFNTGNNLLYLLSALLAGLLPCSVVLSGRSLRRVDASLLGPEEALVGEAVELAARLRADPPGAAGLSLARAEAGERAALPWLAPGSAATLPLLVEAERRGPLRIATWLECFHPWGLVVARKPGPEAELLVLPRLGPPATAPLRLGVAPEGRPSRVPGRGDDLLEIRDYRPGDDARAMDWKATARLERPMVRQSARDEDRRAAVVVDPSPPALEPAEAVEAVEAAISRAAGTVRELIHAGWSVRLVLPEEEVLGREREHLRALARLVVPPSGLPAGWWSGRVGEGEPVLLVRAAAAGS
jgi:uncharacterized protein (DUF58 family)